jgi:hypothetical protein
MQPGPVLTVWAVPSEDRPHVHKWITGTVAPDASTWLRGIDSQPETWRDQIKERPGIGADPTEFQTAPAHRINVTMRG